MRPRALAVTLALTAAVAASSLPTQATTPTDVAGVPASLVGANGPTDNYLRNLELVAHVPMKPADLAPQYQGLGNNGAVALIGDCAYVGRWHDYGEGAAQGQRGVQIVDVAQSSPTFATIVGQVPQTRISGIASTPRELRAIDLPGFKLLAVQTFASNAADRPQSQFNQIKLFDATDCRSPTFVGKWDLTSVEPHEFYLWLDPDPAHNVGGHPRALVAITVPLGHPHVQIVDISNPALPVPVATYDAGLPLFSAEEPGGTYLGTYAHSISFTPDGSRALLSYWDGGFMTSDSSALAAGAPGGVVPFGAASLGYDYSPPDYGNTHSAVKVPGQDLAIVGDEVYGGGDGCPYGKMRVVTLGSATERPAQIGAFGLAENEPANCDKQAGSLAAPAPVGVLKNTIRNANGLPPDGTFSMHNQTVIPGYVFTSWYGGGMRIVDISAPSAPVEVGAFVPKPLTTVRTNSDSVGPAQRGRAGFLDDWLVESWSYPVLRNGLIYITDIRSGLYILRPAAGAPFASAVASTEFAEGNSNVGDILAAS